MESAYHWLFLTALCVLAPCLLLALVQAVRGPRIAARIVARQHDARRDLYFGRDAT